MEEHECEQPKCFGTKEFMKTHHICRNCLFYVSCRDVTLRKGDKCPNCDQSPNTFDNILGLPNHVICPLCGARLGKETIKEYNNE